MSLDVRYPTLHAFSSVSPRWSEPSISPRLSEPSVVHNVEAQVMATQVPQPSTFLGRPARVMAEDELEYEVTKEDAEKSFTFLPFPKEKYDAMQSCVAKGGLPDESGCVAMEERSDGIYVTFPPGQGKNAGQTLKVPDEDLAKLQSELSSGRPCFAAGGIPLKENCFKTGTTDYLGKQTFGIFLDQPLDIQVPPEGSDGVSAGDGKEEKSGWGWWLLGGAVTAGLAVGGVMLWRRRQGQDRENNPISAYDFGRLEDLRRNGTPSMLKKEILDKDQDLFFRKALAVLPNMPSDVLALVLLDEEIPQEIRINAAKNPKTPAAALAKAISGNENFPEVRRQVARNPKTPAASLVEAMGNKEKDMNVRMQAAMNESVPPASLAEFLTNQENSQNVRVVVARNPRTPSSFLAKVLNDKKENKEVRQSAASNKSTPPDALEDNVSDKDIDIRKSVITNSSSPSIVVRFGLKDKNGDVRELARMRLLGGLYTKPTTMPTWL